ncbi:MAG: phage protease, partial [Gammaproteobacteria bacterium]|nr:phage protease [Gammaproteobacteria bacterium]
MYSHPQLLKAMNAALNPLETIALCFELPADGSVPEWVQLVPAGNDVTGIDGRSWINDKPEAVVEYFKSKQSKGRDLPFDWNHSTELKAPKGEDSPAAAWGKEMEVREGGSIWVRTEWNERGRNSVVTKEYRYLSPVLAYEINTGRIVGIDSVALTNTPNLHLMALNSEQNTNLPNLNNKESVMTPEQLKQLAKHLGLDEDASAEVILTAANSLKQEHTAALNSAQNPSLDKFVPRADFDSAVARANNAEQKLKDDADSKLNAEIDTAINSALAVGKITPATKEYHTAMCKQEGGLDRFKAYVAAAPVIADVSNLDKKSADTDKDKALN